MKAAVIAVALIGSSTAWANDPSRQFGVVICVSEAGGPWKEKTRGTLTRTKSTHELTYELKSGEQSFVWRFVSTAQGTTVVSPGYLLDQFARAPVNTAESSPDVAGRRQTLHATGEIREYAPSAALRLVIGTKCPTTRAQGANL